MSMRHTMVRGMRYGKGRGNDCKQVRREHHRRERQRARRDPECPPEYKRYEGWYD